MAPPKLAFQLQSLPPILHKPARNSLSSCSKGAQGLSVLPQVNSICAVSSISLSLLLRQCGNRYAIRAGRNLPDKEFRYLRTVIVTAAVYRGFGSELSPFSLTFRHRAGVRPYTSSCDFAESCVFDKQSSPPGLCDSQQLDSLGMSPSKAHLLPKLRCQLAEFLNKSSLKRLGLLALPTCVRYRYGRPLHHIEAFLGNWNKSLTG